MNDLTPEISAWYQDLASGKLFEIVAVDEDSSSIEYQLVDGEVGEYDIAGWSNLNLILAEAPEDWRSPFQLDTEDKLYADETLVPENWSGPLSDIEAEPMDFGEDFQLL